MSIHLTFDRKDGVMVLRTTGSIYPSHVILEKKCNDQSKDSAVLIFAEELEGVIHGLARAAGRVVKFAGDAE